MKSLARWWARPVVRWGVGIAIGALSLYLALQNISWPEVMTAFKQADWLYMGLALLSVIFGAGAKVIRWRVLMGGNGRRVTFVRLILAHLAGQSLNMIYPARAGDLSRVYVIGELGIDRMFVLGTVILEKLWDMFSYALVFLLLLLLIPLPGWVSESALGVIAITLIFFVASFVVSYQRAAVVHLAERLTKWLPERFHGRFIERVQAGLNSLSVLKSRIDLLKLTFWSTVVWVTAVLNIHLVLLALRLRLPLTASVLILVALQAGISLPTTPGRLGIFQYICVLTLSIYGIDQALAFSYSVLLHSVALLTVLLSGLVCAWVLGLVGQKHIHQRYLYR